MADVKQAEIGDLHGIEGIIDDDDDDPEVTIGWGGPHDNNEGEDDARSENDSDNGNPTQGDSQLIPIDLEDLGVMRILSSGISKTYGTGGPCTKPAW